MSNAAIDIVIYHNPECGTSRNTLAMIRNAGIEPHVIEYLKTPPNRPRLVSLIARMGISARQLLREKGTPFAELGLADPTLSDDQLIECDDRASDPHQPANRCVAARRETLPSIGRGARSSPVRPARGFHQGRWRAGHRRRRQEDRGVNATVAARPKPAINSFERYLSVWVALCIAVGIALGYSLPNLFAAIASAEIARVNLVVAVLIWLMIVPMLLKIDLGALGSVRQHWKGVGVTLFINWAVKPFSMALLGTLFLGWLFRPLLPQGEINAYIAGLILLAAAPCTAMVFVWSNLCDGEPTYTLSQVALNDVIMVFAFAPLVGLLLGVASITVPWATLLISVLLYIVVPVIVAQVIRRALLSSGGQPALDRLLATLGPLSLVALLTTLVLLFGFQGPAILAHPLVIALIAIPILIQVYFNAGLAYWLSRRFGVAWCVAAPAALIGASNFFELAVAAAISLFGLNSGAALATVVGVLVEVPVMLSVVSIVKKTRPWYEQRVPA